MNGCADVRTSLGVYVVGAIDPSERADVDAHLETCPACRDELAGLAGLPALLGRVDEAQLDLAAGPGPEMLDALLSRAAAERRRGPLRRLARRPGGWAPLAAAACALLVAGVLLGGLFRPSGDRDGATPRPSPTASSRPPGASPPPATPPVEQITAEDPQTNIKAIVNLRRKAWGTEVELYLRGVPKGSSCRLMVIARDGRRDALGSWYVPYGDGYGEYRGSTMFPRGQLYSFEIVGLDGRPLLTIPT
ncbi:anti-sigma factor family protein [Spirillospora albida]|uniref:anti-sigma factor family protein n=1 Tax=Spirillospora albida TaxID=58123 RepID=UPI0004BFFB67|nr:zf-HC2 domain-containing protein [Spirillospora albida]